MSKIICDVCGTSFPDSSNQCPICGCAASNENSVAINTESNAENAGHGTYTYVKGGRFSKANVKKRNNNKKPTRDEKATEEEKPLKKEKSNRGLIIAVIALFLAIVAVAAYIVVAFFLPGKQEPAPTDPTPAPTEPATTEPVVEDIPCTDLTCPLTLVLYEEGETVKLEVTVLPEDTTDVITYTSADEAVATVDADGNVTAVAPGETMIEVTCGDKKAFCQVTCDFEAERPEGDDEAEEQKEDDKKDDTKTEGEGSNHLLKDGTYKFNTFDKGPDFSLYPNNTHELVLRDAEGKVVEITITSKTPGVCTVDGNVVRAVAPGNATLIVRFGDGENDFFVCEVIVWKNS